MAAVLTSGSVETSSNVDECAQIHERKNTAIQNGAAAVSNNFAKVLVDVERSSFLIISVLADSNRVGPTLTAHPTKPKWITVLERHRRIYEGLVSFACDQHFDQASHKIFSEGQTSARNSRISRRTFLHSTLAIHELHRGRVGMDRLIEHKKEMRP